MSLHAFFDAHCNDLDVIRDFPFADANAYAQFLAQTRHYVVHTTRLLGATACRVGVEREPLHVRLMQHAAEEKSHHRLAEHDLKKLGRSIDEFPELPITKALYQSQYFRVEHVLATSIFGYIIALEGLAVTYGDWIHEQVCAAHGEPAATFVRLHAHEDVDHMAKTLDAVSQLPQEEQVAIEENYLFTTSLYRVFSSGVHLATLSGLMAARSINSVLCGGLLESQAFEEYTARYRREYAVFYQFLLGFYEIHRDSASYFWSAQKLMPASAGAVGSREAFVRLVSGLAWAEPRFESVDAFMEATQDESAALEAATQIDRDWSKRSPEVASRAAEHIAVLNRERMALMGRPDGHWNGRAASSDGLRWRA